MRTGVISNPTGLVTRKYPSAVVLKLLLWETATRRQHFFMPNLDTWATGTLGKSCSWVVKEGVMCQKKGPRAVSHSFFPLTLYPTEKSQPQQNRCTEGAVVPGWGDSKEGGWRWEPHHQETWRPGDFSELLQTRGSTLSWVH